MTWIHTVYPTMKICNFFIKVLWGGGGWNKAEKAANLELETFIIGYNLWYNSLVIRFI